MDHDAMGRHVQGLLTFRKKIEELLGGSDGAAAFAGRLDTVEKSVAELGARVDASKDAAGDGVKELDAAKLEELGNHVAELAETVTGLQQRLEERDPQVKEGIERLGEMVAWFEENRSALETMLSIGDGLVETEGSTAGATGTEGSAATGAAAGASAGAGGGNAPELAKPASEAAPVTAGPSDANAAPAAAAEPAAAEPAAGSDNGPSSLS
jgi:hypothetical protein